MCFDGEAEVFHGEVIGLRDVVTFQGRTLGVLKAAIWDWGVGDEETGETPVSLSLMVCHWSRRSADSFRISACGLQRVAAGAMNRFIPNR